MGRREEKQQQTRTRIIAAARALFSRDGYEATTTRAIAARARIAHGTLFRYAPTREDVVQLVFEDSIGVAFEKARTTVAVGSFVDVAMHFYRVFFAVYGVDADLARVVARELPFLRGPARDKHYAITFVLFADLAADIEARQSASHAGPQWRADVVPIVVVTSSFSLYYGALVGWLSGELTAETAQLLLLEGLTLLERGCLAGASTSCSPHTPQTADAQGVLP